MDRKDFFHGMVVQAADMDSAFDQVEQRFKDFFVDTGSHGVAGTPYRTGISELVVAEHAPNNFTVDVSKGSGYTKEGERLDNFATSNVDCSVDKDGVSTTPSAGKERYISIYAVPAYNDSDPRVDPINGGFVDFNRQVVAAFEVVAGTEVVTAVPTNAVPPATRTDAVLLADILIADTTATITNALISYTRKEKMVLASTVIQADESLNMPQPLGQTVLAGNSERWAESFPLAWAVFDASGASPFVVKSKYNVISVERLVPGSYKVFVDFDLFSSADHCFALASHNGSFGGVEVEPLTKASPNAWFTFSTWEGDPPAAVENTHTSIVIFGRPA